MLLRQDEGPALGKGWSSNEGVADTCRDLAIQNPHPSQVVQVPDAREAADRLLAGKLNGKCGSETVSTSFYLLGTHVVKAGGEAVCRDVWMSLAK